MSREFDLHVFSCCDASVAAEWSRLKGFTVHPVKDPFWLNVGKAARAVGVKSALAMMGVNKARLIGPVLLPLLAQLSRHCRLILYQGVNLDQPMGWVGRQILSRFSVVVGSSPLLRQQLPVEHLSLPPGIDLARIRATRPANKVRPFRVGYFNHFNKTKGCDIALEAFAKAERQDTEFAVAGTGEMEAELKERYDGRHGIRFLGYLPDPIPEIAACDVMLMPFRESRSVLGLSQTVLECMAAGVPVIGSRVETITGVVRHEREGLIFDDLADAVTCIRRLRDDAELRSRLSENARRRAESFSIDTTAARIGELLRGSN